MALLPLNRPLEDEDTEFTDLQQAMLLRSRERRKSLAGIPILHRTHQIYGGTVMNTTISENQFPDKTRQITFKTAIRSDDDLGGNTGLIFEIGDTDAGVALWVDGQEINLHAGEDGLVNGATATLDLGRDMELNEEFTIICAIRPGDGRVAMYIPKFNNQLIKAQATSETFGSAGAWANDADGAFAQSFEGTVVADCLSPFGPVDFTVIEPLSAYVGFIPQGTF